MYYSSSHGFHMGYFPLNHDYGRKGSKYFFKYLYFLFSPLLGEDSHFDEHIIQQENGWWKTTNEISKSNRMRWTSNQIQDLWTSSTQKWKHAEAFGG